LIAALQIAIAAILAATSWLFGVNHALVASLRSMLAKLTAFLTNLLAAIKKMEILLVQIREALQRLRTLILTLKGDLAKAITEAAKRELKQKAMEEFKIIKQKSLQVQTIDPLSYLLFNSNLYSLSKNSSRSLKE